MKTLAMFTTYHRHRRHPVGHHGHTTNAHTGNVPSHKRGHSHSLACRFSRGTGTDREDHHRSHTLMGHHMHCPRIVVALVPAELGKIHCQFVFTLPLRPCFSLTSWYR